MYVKMNLIPQDDIANLERIDVPGALSAHHFILDVTYHTLCPHLQSTRPAEVANTSISTLPTSLFTSQPKTSHNAALPDGHRADSMQVTRNPPEHHQPAEPTPTMTWTASRPMTQQATDPKKTIYPTKLVLTKRYNVWC